MSTPELSEEQKKFLNDVQYLEQSGALGLAGIVARSARKGIDFGFLLRSAQASVKKNSQILVVPPKENGVS